MSLSITDIKLIAENILKKEEITDVDVNIDYGSYQHPTHFVKSNKTIHINKKSLGITAFTYGINEDVVLTIRMYLEIAHRNNCEVPTYDKYEQFLLLKKNGEISTSELIEYNKIFKSIEELAWDYCENRVKSEYSNHIEDCKRLRTAALGVI